MSVEYDQITHKYAEKCPACSSSIDKGGRLDIKCGANYKFYLQCSRYPLCKNRYGGNIVEENRPKRKHRLDQWFDLAKAEKLLKKKQPKVQRKPRSVPTEPICSVEI